MSERGDRRRGDLVCPWHASRFDVRTGRVTMDPAVEGLATYKVRVVGDAVESGTYEVAHCCGVARAQPRCHRFIYSRAVKADHAFGFFGAGRASRPDSGELRLRAIGGSAPVIQQQMNSRYS